MPPLGGATEWLNSAPLGPAELRGLVVLVNFWTLTCINWLRQEPYIRAWSQAYRTDGLVVIGVHTPEFSFEHQLDRVRQATTERGIDYPVAVDNDYAIWTAFDRVHVRVAVPADRVRLPGPTVPPGAGQAASAHPSPNGLGLTGLGGAVIGGGEEPTGRGFIGGGNQHLNTVDLHLRVLSCGIVGRHRCAQAVTAQQADDQLCLGAAGNDRHRHRRAVHDRNPSAPGPAWRPFLAAWSHVGRPVAPVDDLGRDQSAVPAPRPTTSSVPLAVIFYELFKVVNRRLALLDAFFILVATAIEADGRPSQNHRRPAGHRRPGLPLLQVMYDTTWHVMGT